MSILKKIHHLFVVDLVNIIYNRWWLLIHFKNFKKLLEINFQINRIYPINVGSWHEGFNYFIALKDGKKLFIKTDLSIGLLTNEVLANEAIFESNTSISIPEINFYSNGSKYPFIAFEFIEAKNLSSIELKNLNHRQKMEIANSLLCFVSLLNQLKLVHRDLRKENILFKQINGEVQLFYIDFYFSINKNESKIKLKEVPKEYFHLLKELGEGYAPGNGVWDDAYSAKKIVEEDLQIKDESILGAFDKMINTNTYSVG